MAERARWFWPATAAAAVAVWVGMFALVRRGGLVTDDLLNLRLYRQEGFSTEFLFTPVFDHFAPGHRALTALQAELGPLNVAEMHAVLVSMTAISFVLLAAVLRELYGPRPWVLPVAGLATFTYYAVDVHLWFAAAFHQIPALTFMLACVYTYLRYRRHRRRGWLLASSILMGIGVLFLVKTLLVLPFLLLLEHVVLTDHPLRQVPHDMLAHWRRWAVFGVPVAIYLLITTQVVVEGETAQFDTLLGGLRLGWLARIGPALFGQQLDVSGAGTLDPTATVRALFYQGLLGVAVLASVSRRRASARALLVAITIMLLAMGLALTTRITLVGPGAGLTYRYYLEPVVLGAILLPWGFTGVPDADAPRVWRAPRARWALRGIAVVALAAVAANTVVSDLRVRDGALGTAAGAWLRNAVDAAENAGPGTVEVVNDRVPEQLVPEFWIGAFTLEDVVIYIDGLQVTGDPDSHVLTSEGFLAPVDFTPFYEGTGAEFGDNALVSVIGEVYESGSALCMDDEVSFRILLGPPEDKRYVRFDVQGNATVEYRAVTSPFPRPAEAWYGYPTTIGASAVLLPIDVVPAEAAELTIVPESGTVCLEAAALGHLANDPPLGHPFEVEGEPAP